MQNISKSNNQYPDLAYIDIRKLEPVYEKARELLSEEEKNRTDAFLRRDDKLRYTSARLIEKYYGYSDIKRIGEYGKPIIDNGGYNISHAGDYVFIFRSEKTETGVDVESVNHIFDGIESYAFSEDERKHINSKEDALKYWVMKESSSKLKGTGLGGSAKKNEIKVIDENTLEYNGEKLYYKIFKKEEYLICITSKEIIEVDDYKELDVNNLMENY